MSKIHYMIGDATKPSTKDGFISVICHCCNTIGAWGAGFVVSLAERYPITKLAYKSAIDNSRKTNINLLGKADFVNVDKNIDVANIYGQSEIKSNKFDAPPVRYDALECGFSNVIDHYKKINQSIIIHMPRIGCGLAGGEWSKVEEIINKQFINNNIEVYVYDLPLKNNAVSYRNIDKEIENEIAKYCDKHIYCSDIQFTRTRNQLEQRAGIDGFLTIDSLGIKDAPTDEKAGAHYVNSPIKTYLMELSQITKAGEEVDGWFISEQNKTEYYVLMYLWAQVPQYEKDGKMYSEWDKIKSDNITMIEYYLVKKSDIYDYLKSVGFDKTRLKAAVKYLRTHSNVKKVETKFGFKFVISRTFKECPVNICIEKRIYNKICKLHRYVGKFDYENLTDLNK